MRGCAPFGRDVCGKLHRRRGGTLGGGWLQPELIPWETEPDIHRDPDGPSRMAPTTRPIALLGDAAMPGTRIPDGTARVTAVLVAPR
ncbi:MAG: hypothetical protein AVDCRST_MAG73-3987 [uncultured Thermomicrobiales bacterium]|uniref:Uncharacterized protein n=1 Tax=uncultured Thermomicrobiales bacterium TaxID=1645740 RepID=A0A6J4UZ02_9BACT|nr:MAG: hypothetical protein AVDCRST_MAG73-3987 [uncultured Thermomicrobiales bacterium]